MLMEAIRRLVESDLPSRRVTGTRVATVREVKGAVSDQF